MLKVRIAIMALIWASALLAPAAAQDLHTVSACRLPPTSDYDGPDVGPATPGPTDPNGPSA